MRTCFLRHPRPVVDQCVTCRRYGQDPVFRRTMDAFMLKIMITEKIVTIPCEHNPVVPKDCDTCQLFLEDPEYNQMWGGSGVDGKPRIPTNQTATYRFRQVISPCMYLGEKLPGQACGSGLHICNYDGKTIARFETKCSPGKTARSCEKCLYHPMASDTGDD